jgi:4-amino-4-deoxyprephenate dehydrogenase
MTRSVAPRRSLVIGGGAVGTLFAGLLSGSGHRVEVISLPPVPSPAVPHGDGVRFIVGDITDPGPELAARIGKADMVVLAVPEQAALTALDSVAAAMADGALLVDTLSVKSRIVPAIGAAGPHLEAVSLNPMFAPSLGFAGRPVAVVAIREGPRSRHLLGLIGEWGGRVVPVAADEHDRLAAAVQALPHAAVLAFGLALASLRVDIAELGPIAPPPHRMMLALLARIAGGSPEVYWDVQSANPMGSPARAGLAEALRQLTGLVDRRDQAGFDAALERVRGFLGAELGNYQNACAQAFTSMDVPNRT